MPSHRRLVYIVCMAVLLFARAVAQPVDKGATLKASQDIQNLVLGVLGGGKLADLKASISPEAYVIQGASYLNLYESLYGKDKSVTFPAERGRQMSFPQLSITEDLSSAYLIAKTESSKKTDPRYHSIFFRKTKSGLWQIVPLAHEQLKE